MEDVIVTHGDMDGVISAALLVKALRISPRIVFTQPHQLDQVKLDPASFKEIYVTDIAVNNRDIEMTKSFIETYRKSIKVWVDHHKGWSALKHVIDSRRFIIDESAPSACRVVLNAFPWLKNDPEAVQLEKDGTASDTGRLEQLSPQGWLLYKALKADIQDVKIKQIAVRWLIEKNPEDEKFLREKAEEYDRGPGRIGPYLEKVKLVNDIAVLCEELPKNIDRLALFIKMEEMSPLKVGVMQGTTEYGPVITIGTCRDDLDLVQVFQLPSGNPRNVILSRDAGWTLEKVLEILKKLK